MASTQYSVNEKGEKVIAASRRADGSVRKERRVRPGFLPQDEVPLYVPRHIRERRAAESEHPTSSSASTAGTSTRQRPFSSIPGLAPEPPRASQQRSADAELSARTDASTASSATRGGGNVDEALEAMGKLNIREPTAAAAAREASASASASAPAPASAPIRRGKGSSKFLSAFTDDAESEGSNAVRGGASGTTTSRPAAPYRPPGLSDPWDD